MVGIFALAALEGRRRRRRCGRGTDTTAATRGSIGWQRTIS